jgi:hypothetical protein
MRLSMLATPVDPEILSILKERVDSSLLINNMHIIPMIERVASSIANKDHVDFYMDIDANYKIPKYGNVILDISPKVAVRAGPIIMHNCPIRLYLIPYNDVYVLNPTKLRITYRMYKNNHPELKRNLSTAFLDPATNKMYENGQLFDYPYANIERLPDI